MWTRGKTVFADRVREPRPAYLPPDPAGRISYVAGEIAQCDLCSQTSRCRWAVAGAHRSRAAGADHGVRVPAVVVGGDPLG